MTQFRVSFYGIFTLKDELDVANKKTKKIRRQLKIEREERQKESSALKKMVEEQKKIIEKMAYKLNLQSIIKDSEEDIEKRAKK